jgi:hypothetical protein
LFVERFVDYFKIQQFPNLRENGHGHGQLIIQGNKELKDGHAIEPGQELAAHSRNQDMKSKTSFSVVQANLSERLFGQFPASDD